MNNLKSKEGYLVGYAIGANYTPLEYLQRSNPKTITMPRGFRDMLRSECPQAWIELCNARIVFGFKFRDIIEENFNR